ncbi:MAG TPA: FAD-dependent oxidoreductase [Levilinea sp.]|nr:FAD-dependent oxidoreductase [Levilinea sp.]
MTESIRRYVIVGSGVAAISAVEAIRHQDERGEIVVISDDPHGYYSRPGLAYYLTGEVEERLLFPFEETIFRRLNISQMQAHVHKIHTAEHEVQLANGARLPYDRLLVAVGAHAALPDVPGMQYQGVVKLDHLEDARQILKLARRARRAVVVGGGITALEIVEGLISRKVDVHYFLRSDRYWGNVLDETESALIEHRLKEEGVQIHYHTEMDEVLGKNGWVTAVKTKDGRIINAEILAAAVGIKPRLDLVTRSGLKTSKGIQVDERMQSSAADVFAAGDAAEVIDAAGKSVMNTLWWPARKQGRIAGTNMAGDCAVYTPSPAFNVTRLAGLTTTIIGNVGGGHDVDLTGIARGDSETWRQLPDAIAAQKDFEVNRLRILVGTNTLVGAVVMGDQTLSQAIQVLVTKKVDITPIRDQLLNNQDQLSDVLAAFWTDLREHDKSQVV